MDKIVYGGFAACYIASTLEPDKSEPKPVAQYLSKPRTKRKYKKN